MNAISLEELLEAGCHFGHQVSRQNPKAREFIFEARDNIHIIDLEKTKECLEDAGKFVKDLAKRGGTLLIVGTKRQADGILKEERKRLQTENINGLYFVTKRWIGGTLTNLPEVSKNYKKLTDITNRLQNEYERAKFTKKEINDWEKDRQKLEGFYGGTADMKTVPDALFIIDTHLEHVAAKEALKAKVPTVGITDTNADPTIITYPIPANDDAVGSLKLIINYIFSAWIEGKKAAEKEEAKNKELAAEKASKELKAEKNESEPEKLEKAAEKPAEPKANKSTKKSDTKKPVTKIVKKKSDKK